MYNLYQMNQISSVSHEDQETVSLIQYLGKFPVEEFFSAFPQFSKHVDGLHKMTILLLIY